LTEDGDSLGELIGLEIPLAAIALRILEDEEFSLEIEDEREPWRVTYPLSGVLFLVTCGTVAACDEFDDIAAWGEHHLDFLQKIASKAGWRRCGRIGLNSSPSTARRLWHQP
jgi:hypothetical protein